MTASSRGLLYAGSSGFSYREWVGSLYPEGARADEYLRLYAERLPAVELNTSFYRLPTEEQFARWAAQTPPDEVDLWLPSRNGVSEMDEAELDAMGRLFGDRLPPAMAVKDAIGEMAAAGGAQLVAACRALSGGNGGSRRALINSFGAGGNFLAAVLESP